MCRRGTTSASVKRCTTQVASSAHLRQGVKIGTFKRCWSSRHFIYTPYTVRRTSAQRPHVTDSKVRTSARSQEPARVVLVPIVLEERLLRQAGCTSSSSSDEDEDDDEEEEEDGVAC